MFAKEIEGSVYLYKNDPRVVNKGIHVTNVKQAQGGFAPLLAETDYNRRKFDNKSYAYNAKQDHGSRPMHKTTFSLSDQPDHRDFRTHNSYVIIFIYF
jgi:hypothetical protein